MNRASAGRIPAALGAASAVALVLLTPGQADPPALAAQVRRPEATLFGGTPAVGALFTRRDGRLAHFCTASVVRSPRKDLLITAAHCLQGRALRAITFAPGYHDGRFPHGRWLIRAAYVNREWKQHRNPNDDVAFLVAGRPGRRIEKYTGAETLDTRARVPRRVTVIGYPDGAGRPVRCLAPVRPFAPRHRGQLVFDCGGYPDGTSGGPFLIEAGRATGAGKVIGVIGGYQEGGDTPEVSYSARFREAVAALYRAAAS